MAHLWAAVLNLVQGAAEVLPLSSAAHLKLVPWIFGFMHSYPVLASAQFDIALHAGSAVAILAVFWTDWVDLVAGAVRRDRGKLSFIGFLLLTSIPGAIIGVLFDSRI